MSDVPMSDVPMSTFRPDSTSEQDDLEPLFRNPATRVVRSGSALSAKVDGEVVLMTVENGKYVGLDDVGTDVWERLEQPVSVRDLWRGLSADWAAGPGTIEKDTAALLTTLHREGLIEIQP